MSKKPNQWPQSAAARVAWLEQRLSEWEGNADELGLSEQELTDLAAMVTDSRARLDAALAARSASKSATSLFNAGAVPMSTLAAALIKKIRGAAEATGNPEIYAISQIDPPGTPSPVPAPEAPAEIRTALLNDGSALISWKFTSPRRQGGVTFEIQRRLSTQNTYTFLGNTGEKKFNDLTLPPGTNWASYRIIARRGQSTSDYSEPVIVYLGVPQDAGEGDLTLAA
jgi:uncharacterized small protein (DUF1192 family)